MAGQLSSSILIDTFPSAGKINRPYYHPGGPWVGSCLLFLMSNTDEGHGSPWTVSVRPHASHYSPIAPSSWLWQGDNSFKARRYTSRLNATTLPSGNQ